MGSVMSYVSVTDVNDLTVLIPLGSFVLESDERTQTYIVRLIASPAYTLVVNRKEFSKLYDKLRSIS